MESFSKGDLVLAANATESVWRVLKVRKLGGTANYKCIRISNPRKGDVENFPGGELIPFGDELPGYRVARAATAVIGLLLGFGCAWQAWTDAGDTDAFLRVFALWALVPPTWLIAEYTLIFPRLGNPRNKDDFRHGQGLAILFWAGVATLMLVFYAADAIERRSLAKPAAKVSLNQGPVANAAHTPGFRDGR